VSADDREPSADANAWSQALRAETAEDLYENAPCGYLSTLEDGTFVRVNRTFLNWTGYRSEDLIERKRIHDLLAPGDRIYYETHFSPLLHMQGTVREVAVEVVCADAARLPVLLNSVLKVQTADTPLLVRTTVFDATDRRRYERELLRARREAEERARAAHALAHVNEGVLLVGADGRIQLVNPAGEAILGVSLDAVVGLPAAAAIAAWKAIARHIPIGGPDRWPTPATLPFERAGEEAWLAIAGVETGEGVVYTIRDVTAERRLEELRSDVVAVVSHELRTPLAGMYGAARTLLHQESLDAALRNQLLELIVQQGDAQKRVLDDIAFTSQLDTTEVVLADETLDASELLADVAQSFAGSDGRVAVQSAETVHVRGDRASTQQVLASLVDNALKYSPSGEPVHLAAHALDRWGRFIVADAGPGIPAAEQELVFEKFYRVDPQQRGGPGGIGLGLYIAKALVARMDGRIGLLPTARGATFFVDLPIAT
jgi:PAS domain S-box-containing protein